MDLGEKGAENLHGIERKGESGGSKQSQSAEKKAALSEQKQQQLQQQGGSRTGVFEGNTRFQLTRNHDKHFQFLFHVEALPPNETLGGYIFMCNHYSMKEDLRRQLFGLPQRYRDSVRAASFGGSNIDPTAWEDKKCRGRSKYPAQVRVRLRRLCKPLQEEDFRPFLHHYDGLKFRLQLSVPETLKLLDKFNGQPENTELHHESPPL